MKTVTPRYVVCLRNEGADDLEVRKLYRVVEDEVASERGYLRVVDESGEDYVYPTAFFAPVEVPEDVARDLAAG